MRDPSTRRTARLGLELLEAREVPATNFLAFGAAPGGLPLVEVFRPDGISLGRFEAFESSFRGGVRAVAAQLDGNANTLEVVTVPGPGGGPIVRVFQIDLITLARTELASTFAFDPAFRGGLRVAAGNVAGPDASEEIIVGADAGGGPHVRVFSLIDQQLVIAPGPLGDFFAFEPEFRGGVRVAAGELTGNLLDGDELVVAAGETGGPRVKVFRSDGALLADYFAFQSGFQGGVQVSIESIGGLGRLQIDALDLDPSQRNEALNIAALGPFVDPSLPAGVTGVTPTVPGQFGAGFVGTGGFPTAFGNIGAGTTGGFGTLGTGIGTGGFGTVATDPFGFLPPATTAGFLAPNAPLGVGLPSAVTTTTPGLATDLGGFGIGTTGFAMPSPGGAVLTAAPFPTAAGITTLQPTAPVFGIPGTFAGFTAFGDPGPLTPFPPLLSPPFTGIPIGATVAGTTLFGFGTALIA
jgi:hypothetical protein